MVLQWYMHTHIRVCFNFQTLMNAAWPLVSMWYIFTMHLYDRSCCHWFSYCIDLFKYSPNSWRMSETFKLLLGGWIVDIIDSKPGLQGTLQWEDTLRKGDTRNSVLSRHLNAPVLKGQLSFKDTFILRSLLRCPLKTGFTVYIYVSSYMYPSVYKVNLHATLYSLHRREGSKKCKSL